MISWNRLRKSGAPCTTRTCDLLVRSQAKRGNWGQLETTALRFSGPISPPKATRGHSRQARFVCHLSVELSINHRNNVSAIDSDPWAVGQRISRASGWSANRRAGRSLMLRGEGHRGGSSARAPGYRSAPAPRPRGRRGSTEFARDECVARQEARHFAREHRCPVGVRSIQPRARALRGSRSAPWVDSAATIAPRREPASLRGR